MSKHTRELTIRLFLRHAQNELEELRLDGGMTEELLEVAEYIAEAQARLNKGARE